MANENEVFQQRLISSVFWMALTSSSSACYSKGTTQPWCENEKWNPTGLQMQWYPPLSVSLLKIGCLILIFYLIQDLAAS